MKTHATRHSTAFLIAALTIASRSLGADLVANSGDSGSGATRSSRVLQADSFTHYVENFNRHDRETVVNRRRQGPDDSRAPALRTPRQSGWG